MNDIKIIAVVKFNDGEAYVLNRSPVFRYEEIPGYLFASDGPFYSVYYHETPVGRFKAFAGRKFTLEGKNGLMINCSGQWWDGGSGVIAKKLGISLVRSTYNTVENLKNCYVFYGAYMDEEKARKLREEYTGQVYGYWEYEKLLKQ